MREPEIQGSAINSNQVHLVINNTTVPETEVQQKNSLLHFHHEALPNPKTYIRLLEITHVAEDILEPTCKVASWHVDHTPLYHAISYVWGHPGTTTSIKVNGRELQITTNCHYALRQALWFGAQYVWIDSISIDQENSKYKGQQVEMMGGIYRNASCVLSCVGPHCEESELVMRIPCKPFIHRSKSNHYSDEDSLDMIAPSQRFWERLSLLAWTVQMQSVKIELVLKSLITFLHRPCFKRVWILQEVSIGRDVIICCGIGHRPMTGLYELYRMLHDLILFGGKRWSWMIKAMDAMCSFRSNLSGALKTQLFHIDFRERVSCGSHCQYGSYQYLGYGAYPRDKIYGVLPMVQWEDILPIQPDYTTDPFHVALTVMKTISKQTHISSERSLSIAESLAQSMMLHLNHKTPKKTPPDSPTNPEPQPPRDISSGTFSWNSFFCGTIKSTGNTWKLETQPDAGCRPLKGCLFYRDRYNQRRILRLDDQKNQNYQDYIQVRDNRNTIVALPPRDTRPTNILWTVKSKAEFDLHDGGGGWKDKRLRYLGIRKSAPNSCFLIGQAIVVKACQNHEVTTLDLSLHLHLDVRDALNMAVSWARCAAFERRDLSWLRWDGVRDLLDVKLCGFPISSCEKNGRMVN